MTTENLSRAQASALARLREEYEVNPARRFTAFALYTQVATMNALHKRGLVECQKGSATQYNFYRYIPQGNKNAT